ncbi:MAG: hypothetical protein JF589_09380 [Gemmatimonadetes bacterium]|nr:hypothetical protein [Gemmatimonadota bacterium]
MSDARVRAVCTIIPANAGDAMTRYGTDRRGATGQMKWSSKTTSVARWLVAGAMIFALSPSTAHAQFGRLKKLKEKFSAPDSAARAKDSLAQIAAGVKPESVKVGKSFLQKSASVVSTANGALESATGISAKDAALAATGLGASNLVAKKLGLDPMSIGAQAIANAKMSAQQRTIQKVGGGGLAGGASGMASAGMSAAQMQAMQRAAMANAGATTNRAAMANALGANPAMAGYSQADVDALVTFQQEMMQLSTAASGGDMSARARLEAWQALAMKYQPEAEKLSLAAGAGDMAAVQKLQRLQFDMIKEWNRTGGARVTKKVK